jgi:hypothetical protein
MGRTIRIFCLLGPPIGSCVFWAVLLVALTADQDVVRFLAELHFLIPGTLLLGYLFGLVPAALAGAAVALIEASRLSFKPVLVLLAGLAVGGVFALAVPFLFAAFGRRLELDAWLYIAICAVPTLACWAILRLRRGGPVREGAGATLPRPLRKVFALVLVGPLTGLIILAVAALVRRSGGDASASLGHDWIGIVAIYLIGASPAMVSGLIWAALPRMRLWIESLCLLAIGTAVGLSPLGWWRAAQAGPLGDPGRAEVPAILAAVGTGLAYVLAAFVLRRFEAGRLTPQPS